MLKIKPIYAALLSAILLVAGWPPYPTAILLFGGIAPLLIIHHKLRDSKRRHLKFWAYTCLTMFLFNLGCSWWVWNASPSGAILMLVANTLILSMPFLLFSHTEKAFPKIAYLSLIVYFVAIEYFHFNWNAAWPWMTLGKGLASVPFYIQWYEFTGELGGTVLILIVNIMVFKALVSGKFIEFWKPALLMLVMGGISFLSAFKHLEITKNKSEIECIVTQPNIDPYEEKFYGGKNYIDADFQVEYALDAARPLVTKNTQIVLLPETAIVGFNDEKDLNRINLLESSRKFTDSNNICIIAGAETYVVYDVKERPTITARYDSFSSVWFDNYNTAINIKDNKVSEIYHKSKLVAGVEKMPFDFLEKLSINLGGTSGSLGTSDKAINFSLKNGIKVAPLICYESIFGDYTNEFVRDGAQILAVVTNDGWWGDSPGYMQHLQYGAVRCIETRREMIRSANTGVSAKINQFGKITARTKYKERTAFKCNVSPKTYMTFYVQHGNLIGIISSILAVMFVLSTFVRMVVGRR